MDAEKYLNFPFQHNLDKLNQKYHPTSKIDYEEFTDILYQYGFYEIFEFTQKMCQDTFQTLDEKNYGSIEYEKVESTLTTLYSYFLNEIEDFKQEMSEIMSETQVKFDGMP